MTKQPTNKSCRRGEHYDVMRMEYDHLFERVSRLEAALFELELQLAVGVEYALQRPPEKMRHVNSAGEFGASRAQKVVSLNRSAKPVFHPHLINMRSTGHDHKHRSGAPVDVGRKTKTK